MYCIGIPLKKYEIKGNILRFVFIFLIYFEFLMKEIIYISLV